MTHLESGCIDSDDPVQRKSYASTFNYVRNVDSFNG